MRVTVVKKNKKHVFSTTNTFDFQWARISIMLFFSFSTYYFPSREGHTQKMQGLCRKTNKNSVCAVVSAAKPTATELLLQRSLWSVFVCVCVWRKVREVTDETDSDSGNSTFLQQPLAAVSEADWEKNVKNSPQIPKEKSDPVDISGLGCTFSW